MSTRATSFRTLHLSLTEAIDAPLTLHAGGKEYSITLHTPETLSAHRERNQVLAAIPGEHLGRITHFVDEVEFSATTLTVYYATRPAADSESVIGDIVATGIHVPLESRKIAARRRQRDSLKARHPAVLGQLHATPLLRQAASHENFTLLADAGDFMTPYEAAKTILFNHPEVASINPEIAADMLDYYIEDALDHHPELWQYISRHPAGHRDPWTINTIARHADGTPVEPPAGLIGSDNVEVKWPTDVDGNRRLPLTDLHEGTLQAAKPTLDYLLRILKDEARLQGIAWQRSLGIPSTQDKQGIGKPASQLQSAVEGAMYKWTLANPGSSWGLEISDNIEFDGDTQTVRIGVKNKANRCLGAYVEFLDSQDKPITPKDWVERIKSAQYRGTASKKYLQFIRPADCIMGIPLGGNTTTLVFPFADGAVKARILLAGLGTGKGDSEVDHLGRNTTGILNYGVPGLMIGFGVGMDSSSWLYSLFTNPLVLEALLGVLCEDGDAWLKTMTPELFLRKASAAIGSIIFSQALIHLIAKPLVARVVGAQVAQAMPIAGWVMKVMCLTAATGMMISTTVAVTNAPAVYDLKLSRAIDVAVTVKPDPVHGGEDAVWPLQLDYYTLTLTHQSGTSQTMGPFPRSTLGKTIQHTFVNVAAGNGENIQISVNLYAKNQWMCGAWVSDWINAATTDGSSTIQVGGAIIERLVPLTSSTVYEHKKVLSLDKNGARYWRDTHQAPTAVAKTVDSDGIRHVTKLINLSLNNHAYRLGYTWRADQMGLPLDNDTTRVQTPMHVFQCISTLADPNKGAKFPSRGFSVQPYLTLDQFGPEALLTLPLTLQKALDSADQVVPADIRSAFNDAGKPLENTVSKVIVAKESVWTLNQPGGGVLYVLKRRPSGIMAYASPYPEFSPRNFYLDPRGSRDSKLHLRHVDLSAPATDFDYGSDQSWGVFNQQNLDAVIVHPGGYAIGVNYAESKMEILKLQEAPTSDAQAELAIPMSGKGALEGLLNGPKAMTVTADGRVLLLEQNNSRVQAFDTTGNAVQCFAGPLHFELDASFAVTLDKRRVSPALTIALLAQLTPSVAPRAYLEAAHQAELNKAELSETVRQALTGKGLTLAPTAFVEVVTPDQVWLIHDPDNQLAFDVRNDGHEIPVRGLADFSVEMESPGSRWLLRDATNAQTFRIQKDAENKLQVQQLIATLALNPRAEQLQYLDIACEPEGFIYVLSHLNSGSSPNDYRLDIYNPDGSHLSRTPSKQGDACISAAKISVDHWRTLFTLNYETLTHASGPHEPSISQWAPSLPNSNQTTA
ncbi:hypothetical protein KW842_02835 [Duganella sp. sic0402]|uniref:hypothetical protein n=1 Tax=Duganella sp. sic0402 TaxID=2854786 RepID=UPI001C44092F|nr:hypothetical protein [Duganella sp. sic0402]MBV7534693.1 hypothetical protein [Duganella sp. sic0402]